MPVHDLTTIGVNEDSPASLKLGNSISSCAKIKNLVQHEHNRLGLSIKMGTHFYKSKVVALYSSDTATIIELDLPHTTQVGE